MKTLLLGLLTISIGVIVGFMAGKVIPVQRQPVKHIVIMFPNGRVSADRVSVICKGDTVIIYRFDSLYYTTQMKTL